jgi:dihydroorotase (multifunctional complex type)
MSPTELFLDNIVLPGGERAALHAAEGRIVAIGPGLARPRGAERANGEGLLALPGLIDVHVHLREPGGEHKEDFTSGTRAALAGGYTTVLAMPNTSPPVTDRATLALALERAAAKAVCDYGQFAGATPHNAAEVAGLAEACGLKLYMGSSTGDLLVDDFAGQAAHFSAYPRERVLAVHAENEAAVRWYAERGERRPPLCAALETARALVLAEHFGRRVHICHVSTVAEARLIRDARARGAPVTAEVAPHHLFLARETEADAAEDPLQRMNPPLRGAGDVESLWSHLEVFDAIASDHAPHTLEEKAGPNPPSGVPGLESSLPLLLTAVHAGRLTLAELVRLTSAGPAAAFGLRAKGRLAPGYDADVTLVDPDVEWTFGERPLQTRCGWSPFQGWRVRGRVERVYLRGQLACAGGAIVLEPGAGRRVENQPAPQ